MRLFTFNKHAIRFIFIPVLCHGKNRLAKMIYAFVMFIRPFNGPQTYSKKVFLHT